MIRTITFDDADWQVVPKVATPEIRNAMNCATHVLNDLRSARAYEAALSAAPQPPCPKEPPNDRASNDRIYVKA